MKYGNQNSKKLVVLIVVILFIGGMVKGLLNANSSTIIETTHLTFKVPNEFTVVKDDKEKDFIQIKDDTDEAQIQYGNIYPEDTVTSVTIVGEYEVKESIDETDGYTLHLLLTKDNEHVTITYQPKFKITVKNAKIQKLIQNIEIKENA